ncbi:MAG TPA: thioredoxin family protein [Holophaga sp.]|nr:thioredoxin family protein [Holophaga sp.]
MRPSPLFLAFAAVSALQAQVTVPALDPAGLAATLKSRTWVIIEFGGPTCVPCVRMQPILGELQAHFGTRALVRNFYVTQHPAEARAHKVMAMPTQVVFDPSGKEVARHIGFWPKADFLEALGKAGLK